MTSQLTDNITRAAIQRAKDADPNLGRCLVENSSPNGAILATRVFDQFCGQPAATDPDLLDALEWGWKMKRGTFSIDTRRNIFFVGASMHELYKDKKWALLPTEQDVLHFFNRGKLSRKVAFVDVERETYFYTIIPLGDDMQDLHISYQSDDRKEVSVFDFPFENLHVVESHVNPRFAILHLGEVLRRTSSLSEDEKSILLRKCPYLSYVKRLHAFWTMDIDPDEAPYNTHILPGPYHKGEDRDPSVVDNGPSTPLRRTVPIRKRDLYQPSYHSTLPPSEQEEEQEDTETDENSLISEDLQEYYADASLEGVRLGSEFNNGRGRRLTSVERSRKAGVAELQPMRWTAGRIKGWAKRCRSPTPEPEPSSAKPPLRRSTRTRKKPKLTLN
ncbi:hypothetical protein CVT24_001740 [Panaeolus cyanescens]|uniref:HNH nuclease domain-containing protein n=1 Tax=Panaeolus cyanescens TaxID=181874 RepID=A0A409YFS1_9AGAR|nr:hypothetical protein CVT24_001740 [Panaeolus cyanescens]